MPGREISTNTISRPALGEILEEGRSIASELKSVAAAFKTGTITTTFVSYAAEVSGGQKLQFATDPANT